MIVHLLYKKTALVVKGCFYVRYEWTLEQDAAGLSPEGR